MRKWRSCTGACRVSASSISNLIPCGVRAARPATITRTAVSLAPVGARTKRAQAVSTALHPVAKGSIDLLVSVRDDRFRMLVSPKGPQGLFNLMDDPEGLADVSSKSGDDGLRLQKALAEWDESLQAVPGAPPLPGPNPGAQGSAAPPKPPSPPKAGGTKP